MRAIVDRLGVGRFVCQERLSGGASQETYRITIDGPDGEGAIVLRRASSGEDWSGRSAEAPGLGVEAQLLRCARAGGVPVPEVLHVLDDADGLGVGIVLEWLDGETFGSRIVRSERFASVRRTLAYQCGAILGRLHRLEVGGNVAHGALAVFEPAELVSVTWDRYRSFGVAQPMIDFAARWLLDHLPASRPPTLVHGDFRNGNLMISDAGVIGVLDWELAHLGDPMRDLGWICTGSWRFGRHDLPVGGFGTREDLFAGYESVSGVPVDRGAAHFWEVFGSFWWAVGCLGMVEAYRTGVDRTVERLAIGRRSSECQIDLVNLLIPGDGRPSTPRVPGADGMPSVEEMLAGVASFLRDDVALVPAGRTAYLGRVTANMLDIIGREHTLGPVARDAERARLSALGVDQGWGCDATTGLADLRRMLIEALRNGLALDATGLTEHLRATVSDQIAIDQPGYAGFSRKGAERP